MSSSDHEVYSGRYELQRKVARGGMADVFLSRDLLLDRPVALKVLFPEFASDPAFVQRFRREAQSAARLTHPNVVSVFDWGQEGTTYFIVMEYVEGQSLAQLLRESGRMEPDRAATIAADVADALAFAHEHGVVHRDVKPGNVMIARGGHVKVADFGIARAVSSAENLTQTGTVMGTATYFSPEQARGGAVDPRSDVYSLGVVLYEMLTGTPPFTGDNPVSVAYKHVQELPAPPRRLREDIPEGLEAIVLKAINKNPANRYATAGEMRADLRRYLAGRPVLAEPLLPVPEGSDITAAVPAAAFGAAAAGALADPTTRSVPMEPHTVVVPRGDGGYGGYPPERPRRRGWLVFLAVLVLLAALVAGGYLLLRSLGVIGPADQVTVPDVVGLTEEEARIELRDANLEPVIEGVTDPAPVGRVLAQDPGAGREVDEDSSVTLRVSTGPEQKAVPNVVGGTEDEARVKLVAAGFQIGDVTRQRDEQAPSGEVLSQSPQPDAVVDTGTTVNLVVSSGPAPVTVPDVRTLPEGAAIESLSRAGLDPERGADQPNDLVPAGSVVNTDPAPGTSVRRDSRVVYFVSSGPATTTTSSTSTTSTTEPDGGGGGGGGGGN